MLKGSSFARASYAMFAVAVLMAILKLNGTLDAKSLFLKTVPAEPVAKSSEPAVGRKFPEREASKREAPDLHQSAEPTTGPSGRLVAGISGGSNGEKIEVPVFHRPSSGDSGGPVCGDLGDFPRSSRVVFPLPDEYFNSYDDTWGAARPQGGHEGSDLMSPAGTPEFAITDGTLVPVKGSSENGWNRLGGYTVMLKAAYEAGPIKEGEGDLFYYAHMDEESTLPIGTEVRAGQKIGTAGDTGEGPEATRGKFPSHLHLGWYDGSGDRATLKSGAMNPYPLLLWLEQNGGAVSGGTDVSYCEAPQGPVPKPSTGESFWPAPDSPGTTPDLDTGDRHDPRPSPAVEEPRQDHPPKQAETARKGSSEKEKVVKKRKVRKATPKSISEKREARRAGTPARTENGSAREVARASRPSGAESSPQPESRDESQPFPTGPSRRSYASILADVIEEPRTTKDRDGRDAPDEEKREKPPNSTKSKSPKESRSAPDTRKTPAASEEKSEPEEREPEEKSAPSGTPGEPEDEEAPPKGGPG